MTDKKSQQHRLVLARAKALATLLLTDREGLRVQELPGSDFGPDYLVTISDPGKRGLRQFGVGLRATLSPVTAEAANEQLRPVVQELFRRGPFHFPVCLFYFTEKESEAFYTWVAEPRRAADGAYKLVSAVEADCRPLCEKALDRIVATVQDWYDAFYADQVSVPDGGRPKRAAKG